MAGIRYLTVPVLAALLLLASLSVSGAAFAQAQQCSSTSSGCDQGVAYAACMSELKTYIGAREASGEVFRNVQCTVGSPTTFQARFENRLNSGSWSPGIYRTYTWGGGNCAARLDGDVGLINGTMYSGGVCDRGCKVQPNLGGGSDFSLRESGSPNAISIKSGTWRASGELCSIDSTPPKPEKKDEYCHQSGNYTVCKSKDRTCISTASGFRTCASDTANEKGHTATNNPRTEATSISAPNTPPNPPTNRPGEDWKPSGPSTSVTNNNTGSTTNTQNYNNQGTPNGNQPTPGDGSGPGAGGSNGNGEQGEGSGNSASGGGNCQTPPATSGDPILGMIATQTWATRCAAEKGNSAKVTGDIGNCDVAFSVEGDSVQANQLRAQRAQLCAGRPGEGQGSSGNPHDGAEDVDGPGKWTWKFDEDLLDKSGFGGGSCPQLGTLDFGSFGTVSMDGQTWWCPLISAMHVVMLMLGAFISYRIIFGD